MFDKSTRVSVSSQATIAAATYLRPCSLGAQSSIAFINLYGSTRLESLGTGRSDGWGSNRAWSSSKDTSLRRACCIKLSVAVLPSASSAACFNCVTEDGELRLLIDVSILARESDLWWVASIVLMVRRENGYAEVEKQRKFT